MDCLSEVKVRNRTENYAQLKTNESGSKPNLNRALWGPDKARNVAADWQRAYIELIFNHPINTQPEGVTRTLHPFAITQLSDMLEEFSQFNFLYVFVGYGIMVNQFLSLYYNFSIRSKTKRNESHLRSTDRQSR